MRLKVEVELARGAPTTALNVLVLVLAVRRGLARNVGQVSHEVVLLLLESSAALGQTVNLLVDGAHGLLGGLGLVLLALLHQGADLLGLGIARSLELLDLGDDGTSSKNFSRSQDVWRLAMATSMASGFSRTNLISSIRSSGDIHSI